MNIVVFVSLMCLSSVLVRSQEESGIAKRGGMKFCGAHLANTLQLLCHGTYNRYWKKDTPYNAMSAGTGGSDDYIYDQLAEDPKWPFLSRQSASAMMPRSEYHGRYRRGVIEECCQKSCSIEELQSYCA